MSMIEDILHSWGPGEDRFALIAQGRVCEFVVSRPRQVCGALFLGRVVQVNKALGAAFVDIGDSVPGFLPLGKPHPDRPRLSQGMSVVVQAQTEARGAKGAKLSLDPFLPGRFWGYSPTRYGLSLSRRIAEPERSALEELALRFLNVESESASLREGALHADADAVQGDLENLRMLWRSVQEKAAGGKAPCRLLTPDPLCRLLYENPRVRRIVTDDPIRFPALRNDWPDHIVQKSAGNAFDAFDAEEVFEQALSPTVALPSGGTLTFQATRALTAIDIDSGGSAPQDSNREATAEIARQIRLRNESGQLVADFIPIGKRGSFTPMMESLRQAVKADPIPTHILGVTPLGLVEIMRERRRPSLAEIYLDAPSFPIANATSVALSALRRILRSPAGHAKIVASPDVIDAMRNQTEAFTETERRLGRSLILHPDPSRHREDISIEVV